MIQHENYKYDTIKQFDCHILSMENIGGGSYFTAFAVSPKEYRKVHPTMAVVRVRKGSEQTVFEITDDWGKVHRVTIDNCHAEEIQAAIEAAKVNELLDEVPE